MIDNMKIQYCKLLLLHSDITDNHNEYLNGLGNIIELGKNIKTNTLNLYLLKNSLTDLSIYLKDKSDLSSKKKELYEYLEFMNHLRNLIGGHLDNKVIGNAIQWEPAIFDVKINNEREAQLNLFYKSLIESAINSYVDKNGKHKVFDSEIDLFYPPNQATLFDYLEKVNTLALNLIENILIDIKPEIKFIETQDEYFQLALEAGKTEFNTKNKKYENQL